MEAYSVDIAWSDEDEGYIATVSEFRYLSAYGETREEALAQAGVALEAFIETYQESGRPLPPPRKRESHSGQLRVRMPKSLHSRLAARAEQEGVSLNQLIVSFLSEGMGYRQAEAERTFNVGSVRRS